MRSTAAQASFPAWRGLTAKERGTLLLRVADEVHKRADEIARIITLENGKPLAQSKGEMAMTEDHLRWFAEEGRRAYGRLIPHQVQGKRNMVVRTPIGVVGAIAPWNFPLVSGRAQSRAGAWRPVAPWCSSRRRKRRFARWPSRSALRLPAFLKASSRWSSEARA